MPLQERPNGFGQQAKARGLHSTINMTMRSMLGGAERRAVVKIKDHAPNLRFYTLFPSSGGNLTPSSPTNLDEAMIL